MGRLFYYWITPMYIYDKQDVKKYLTHFNYWGG